MQQRIIDELFSAIGAGGTEFASKVEELTSSKTIDINQCWKHDCSLLMAAARSGRADAVLTLTMLGANVNAVSQSGRTALMEAVAHKQYVIIAQLVAAGADIFAQDQGRRSAIDIGTSIGAQVAASLAKEAPVPLRRTWLYPLLAREGLSEETIALCEQKLVHEEKITSAKLFAAMSRKFSDSYLCSLGVETAGERQIILNVHSWEQQKQELKTLVLVIICFSAVAALGYYVLIPLFHIIHAMLR